MPAPARGERWWCGTACYPGHTPFILGNVRATGHETARAELLALWASMVPHPPPERIDPLPGRLVLDEDAAAEVD